MLIGKATLLEWPNCLCNPPSIAIWQHQWVWCRHQEVYLWEEHAKNLQLWPLNVWLEFGTYSSKWGFSYNFNSLAFTTSQMPSWGDCERYNSKALGPIYCMTVDVPHWMVECTTLNGLELVMLLIFIVVPIQMQPNSVTNLKMWSNSMPIMKCLILGLCPPKDARTLLWILAKFCTKEEALFSSFWWYGWSSERN